MGLLSILWAIVVGFVVGAIARFVFPGVVDMGFWLTSAIGIGGSASEPVNDQILEQLAASTGGLYYKASVSQNLPTIYQQLASVLYSNQYVLRFEQLTKGSVSSPSSVLVGASLAGVTGSGAAPIASCN